MFVKKSSIVLLVVATSVVAIVAGEAPAGNLSGARAEPLWQFATGG